MPIPDIALVGAKSSVIEGVIIRADGTVENLGILACRHSNWFVNGVWQVKQKFRDYQRLRAQRKASRDT